MAYSEMQMFLPINIPNPSSAKIEDIVQMCIDRYRGHYYHAGIISEILSVDKTQPIILEYDLNKVVGRYTPLCKVRIFHVQVGDVVPARMMLTADDGTSVLHHVDNNYLVIRTPAQIGTFKPDVIYLIKILFVNVLSDDTTIKCIGEVAKTGIKYGFIVTPSERADKLLALAKLETVELKPDARKFPDEGEYVGQPISKISELTRDAMPRLIILQFKTNGEIIFDMRTPTPEVMTKFIHYTDATHENILHCHRVAMRAA